MSEEERTSASGPAGHAVALRGPARVLACAAQAGRRMVSAMSRESVEGPPVLDVVPQRCLLLVEADTVHGVYVDDPQGRAAAEADRVWLGGDDYVRSMRVESWTPSRMPLHAGRVVLPNRPADESRLPLGWARAAQEALADLTSLTGGFEVFGVHDRSGVLTIDLDVTSIAQGKRDQALAFVAAVAEDSSGLCAICGQLDVFADRDDRRRARCPQHRHADAECVVIDWPRP